MSPINPSPAAIGVSKAQPAPERPGTLRWLWQDRIPIGSLTAFFGLRGSGKSFVIADLAARVSTGAPWPDAPDVPQEPGSVLLISAERQADCVLVPRLIAAGADLSKIDVVQTFLTPGGRHQTFQITELEALENLVRQRGDVRLIVIDPFTAFVREINNRRTSALADLMDALEDFAERMNVAIVLVNATDKGATGTLRPNGANVLPYLNEASRTVWALDFEPEEPAHRLFLPVRLGLAPERGGLRFTIDRRTGAVAWDREPIVLRGENAWPAASAMNRAMRWLQEFLSAGPRRVESVLNEGRIAGHSRRALYGAKGRLSVQSIKKPGEFSGVWYWGLPGWDLGMPGGRWGTAMVERPEPSAVSPQPEAPEAGVPSNSAEDPAPAPSEGSEASGEAPSNSAEDPPSAPSTNGADLAAPPSKSAEDPASAPSKGAESSASASSKSAEDPTVAPGAPEGPGSGGVGQDDAAHGG